MTETARARAANARAVNPHGDYVLYWMIAARRASSNVALDRAVSWARELHKPLVVLEALRVDYPYASDRFHQFILDGMADNARAFASSPALYYPYVEPRLGAGRGLLEAIAASACLVVTDEFPCFFLPHMVAAAADRIDVRLEAVDGNGLLPMRTDRTFAAASHFRWHVQKQLPGELRAFPSTRPFRGVRLPPAGRLPRAVTKRWPAASAACLAGGARALARLPIDHEVTPVRTRGGSRAARRALSSFVAKRLEAYADAHNHPDANGTSRLSPYLHFGHLSVHEVFEAVMRRERWTRAKLAARPTGAREGWWGVGRGAEAFLDQLIVWRELAFNGCASRPDDYSRYEALPAWARATLDDHASDPRSHRYSTAAFESAATHDPLWNAAQRQMRRDGWFHGYLRMLWGKKILEWSPTPRQALATMEAIMNRWSLDGRDPNSYAGYLWTLGQYDRPWPERPIYGKVRSMSSENTARKVRVESYLRRYRS